MKTNEQIKEEILHPKMFVFPVRWWEQIKQLTIEKQKDISLIVLNYVFEHKAPGILYGNDKNVWEEIVKDIASNEKRKKKYANVRLEKESAKEQEESLSALSKEEKEITKEKELKAREFAETLRRKYPRVAAMSIPLTYDEHQKLLQKYPNSLIVHILIRMNAWRDIDKYLSAYRTCCNWLLREKRDIESQGRWAKYAAELKAQLKILKQQDKEDG